MNHAMQQAPLQFRNFKYPKNYHLNCDWKMLRTQLILRWSKLDSRDLDEVGPDAPMLANLIQQKYGIAAELAENYLRNIARTLPVTC